MISAILAIVIVNSAQKLYMKVIGASAMFFSGKKKIAWYVVVWFILMSIIGI